MPRLAIKEVDEEAIQAFQNAAKVSGMNYQVFFNRVIKRECNKIIKQEERRNGK